MCLFFGRIFLLCKERLHPLCRYNHSVLLDLLLDYTCRCVAERAYMVCGTDKPALIPFFYNAI